MLASNQDYLTLQQLAEYLRRSTRTVQRMIQHGQAPPFIQLGRRRLFAKSSVIEWLTSREHLPHMWEKGPQLDLVAALQDLEKHGKNGAACRLFVSAHGEPLSPEVAKKYLCGLLAAGIKRLPLMKYGQPVTVQINVQVGCIERRVGIRTLNEVGRAGARVEPFLARL